MGVSKITNHQFRSDRSVNVFICDVFPGILKTQNTFVYRDYAWRGVDISGLGLRNKVTSERSALLGLTL